VSENQSEPVEPDAPVEPGATVKPDVAVASDVPGASDVPVVPEPPGKRIRRGRLAAVAGSVLLAGAVVAGVGYTVVTVDGADRDAGAPVWKFPKAKAEAEETKAAARKGLAGVLVPYGGTDGWSRGPDLGAYGSDVQLDGARATALQKESLSDLPRSQRKRLEEKIDKLRIQGMAMRSYYTHEARAYNNEDIAAVSIRLAQMDSKAAVRNISTFQNEFLDALDVFRKGPEIKGHKNARCFLPPKDADEDLDSMFCSAYVGDILVTAAADGVKPLDSKEVALLLRTQLDRIAEPGEAV
jgi:hypothetical protein